jgi:hypothetical protein
LQGPVDALRKPCELRSLKSFAATRFSRRKFFPPVKLQKTQQKQSVPKAITGNNRRLLSACSTPGFRLFRRALQLHSEPKNSLTAGKNREFA